MINTIRQTLELAALDLVETLIIIHFMDILVCVYNVCIKVSPPSSLSSTGSMGTRKPIVSSKCRIYPSVTELYWQLYVRTTMNNSIRFLVLIFSKLCSSWVFHCAATDFQSNSHTSRPSPRYPSYYIEFQFDEFKPSLLGQGLCSQSIQ